MRGRRSCGRKEYGRGEGRKEDRQVAAEERESRRKEGE